MDYKKTAERILELVGGESNVSAVTHCITRLRFTLKDQSKADDKKIEAVPGVLRVICQGGQYQVVIGNEVANVYKALLTLGNFSDSSSGDAAEKPKENLFSRLCGFISGCMTPLLPAMMGCGMMKVVLTLLTTFGLIDTTGSTYVILNVAGDAFFYFLPILLATTIAKRMGSSPYLAMVMGAIFLHPDLTALLAEGSASYFGLPVTAATYSSSVLPIFLMVPIMAWLEKLADKVCPSLVKIFLKPLLVVFISIPIALVVVGPLGTIVGNYLAEGINLMYGKMGWLTIMVLSAAMPFIVMTGMHYALIPLCTINLASLGFDAILITTMFCSNVAQGGASLAVAFRSKDENVKSTASAAGFSAVVAGVTEPAMYGVTLKYKTPMIAAVIGAGIAGLYCGITHVVGYTMGGSPSALTLIQMIGGEGMGNLLNGAVALVISVVVSFVLTALLYKPEETKDTENAETQSQDAEKNSEDVKNEKSLETLVEKQELVSPISGNVIELREVEDPVFAEGVLGQGVAILPEEGKVFAPADGVISAVMDSKHAIGMTAAGGAEILIHVGLDTVKLNGEGFTLHCSMGDQVKKGDLLLEFDMEMIKGAGLSLTTPVLVSNMNQFVSLKASAPGPIKVGESLMTIV